MTLLIVNGIFFLVCSLFGMYSMYKNDCIITNRWLFLTGWFLFVCTISLSAINFLNYFTAQGIISFSFATLGIGLRASVSDYVTGGATILFALYLFSLRKKCMNAEYLPRTFRIWITRWWHSFKYRRQQRNTKQLEFKF
jgi:hypothetical protein